MASSPTETRFWFGDTRVARLSFTEERSAEAVVIFHGFPGQPPKGQEHLYADKPRVRFEAAKALVAAGLDVYLPGYDGLGECRGTFGFEKSVRRSAELAAELAGRGYARLHVAGHSWGGFVACEAHRALGARAGKLALLAGLLDLPDSESVRAFLPDYLEKYPDVLGDDAGAAERAAGDLDRTRLAFNPLTFARPMAEDDLLIAHGRPDAYVDVELSRRFHRVAGGRLIESEADHLFSGEEMAPVVELLVSFFTRRA